MIINRGLQFQYPQNVMHPQTRVICQPQSVRHGNNYLQHNKLNRKYQEKRHKNALEQNKILEQMYHQSKQNRKSMGNRKSIRQVYQVKGLKKLENDAKQTRKLYMDELRRMLRRQAPQEVKSKPVDNKKLVEQASEVAKFSWDNIIRRAASNMLVTFVLIMFVMFLPVFLAKLGFAFAGACVLKFFAWLFCLGVKNIGGACALKAIGVKMGKIFTQAVFKELWDTKICRFKFMKEFKQWLTKDKKDSWMFSVVEWVFTKACSALGGKLVDAVDAVSAPLLGMDWSGNHGMDLISGNAEYNQDYLESLAPTPKGLGFNQYTPNKQLFCDLLGDVEVGVIQGVGSHVVQGKMGLREGCQKFLGVREYTDTTTKKTVVSKSRRRPGRLF